MSTSDDDLLAGLRRSADPADRRLADLLGGMRPPRGQRVTGPRASGTLAAFLAASDPVAAAPLDTVTEPASAPDIVVELGRKPPRSSPMRSHLVPLGTLLRTSLLAKFVLGATVALTGAGAVAATTGPDTGSDVVTVVPASDSDDAGDSGDDPSGVLEVDDDHEAQSHAGDADDGPDPEDADEPDDDAEDAEDANEADDAEDTADDDQGDDNDDQGENEQGDDDQGDDEQADDEAGDEESGDDESGDDESGDDESGDDESGDDD